MGMDTGTDRQTLGAEKPWGQTDRPWGWTMGTNTGTLGTDRPTMRADRQTTGTDTGTLRTDTETMGTDRHPLGTEGPWGQIETIVLPGPPQLCHTSIRIIISACLIASPVSLQHVPVPS